MTSWFNDVLTTIQSFLQGIDARAVLSFLGEKLFEGLFQALTVLVIGWLVFFRQWRQLIQGKSDQVVFSANLLTPLPGQGAHRREANVICYNSARCWRPRRSTSYWTTWLFAS